MQPTHIPDSPDAVAGQAPAISALATIMVSRADLPAPYIVILACGDLVIQTRTLAEIEPWRAALGLAADAVELIHTQDRAWLAVEGAYAGTRVRLTAHGIILPATPATETAAGAVLA